MDKCNDKRECEIQTVVSLSGSDGWALDNFEGLTHYDKDQYLMISDNNNNPLQNTVLVLFELNL